MKQFILIIILIQLSISSFARNHNPKTVYINGVTNKVEWQEVTDGNIPSNAYVAFKNQQGDVHICQAIVPSGVSVGLVQGNQCAVVDNNHVTKTDNYQVLIANDSVKWLSRKDMYKYYSRNNMGYLAKNSLPIHSVNTKNKYMPVIGGFTYISRYYPQMNYICRGMHDVEIVIGAMIRNKCQLVYGDKVVNSDMYQILTIKSE